MVDLTVFGTGGGDFSVLGYSPNQDFGIADVSSDQTTVTLTDNAWKRVAINKTITPETVLTFEFDSSFEGEIHGIGFDTDNDVLTFSQDTFFQLDGPQQYGLQDFNGQYSTGSGFELYEIRVGDFFTGAFENLVFNADHDLFPVNPGDPSPDGVSAFRNITFSERPQLEIFGVGGGNFSVVSYSPDQDFGTADVSADQTTVTVTDNGWKRVAINKTVTPDTVLSFEFSSGFEGEIHGIGFDTDNEVLTFSQDTFFQLDGSQQYGLQDFDDQYVTGSGFQRYEINIGEFFTGEFENLVFSADHDLFPTNSGEPGPDGESVFRNIVFSEGPPVAAVFNLADLDGPNGFRLEGVDPGDFSGRSVSGAGDVNGDGFDDVIIGSYQADPNQTGEAGESYVVFGSDDPFNASVDLAQINGSNGFQINGIDPDDRAGRAVSGAGDVNGDGFDDVIIGAYTADVGFEARAGESYVVFGGSGGAAAGLDLADLDGDNGFRIDGIGADDFSGFWVSGAGDINGDGIDDVAIGTNGPDAGGTVNAGQSYVVFGSKSGLPDSIALGSLDGDDGFRLNGVDLGDFSGRSISGIGDINGDGIDDLALGAPYAFETAGDVDGEAYVVFGSNGGFSADIDLSSLNGNSGFIITNTESGLLGWSVSGAGDVNGDGVDDLVVGATGAASANDTLTGQSYVVFGTSGGFSATFDLQTLDGSNGFVLDGVSSGDLFGFSVSSAGDFNGDGIHDIIVSSPTASQDGETRIGSSYLVFGNATGFNANINVDLLNGVNGFRMDGLAQFDRSGWSVSSAGDFNGDGFDDLVLGAPYANPNGELLAGSSYITFGGPAGPGSAPTAPSAVSVLVEDEIGSSAATELEIFLSGFQNQSSDSSSVGPFSQSAVAEPLYEEPSDDGSLWMG